MLILDECLGALSTGLIDREALFSFIRQKPPELELVLTGRNPPDELVELADYVSEIRCVKHPYTRGIPARDGIEHKGGTTMDTPLQYKRRVKLKNAALLLSGRSWADGNSPHRKLPLFTAPSIRRGF